MVDKTTSIVMVASVPFILFAVALIVIANIMPSRPISKIMTVFVSAILMILTIIAIYMVVRYMSE